jgi:mitochondrial fission process protein 1
MSLYGKKNVKFCFKNCQRFNLRQLLASVMIPGFTINRICWAVGKGLKLSKFKHPTAKWIPTMAGLLSIPLIIRPIDHGVDILMDETYRKYVL